MPDIILKSDIDVNLIQSTGGDNMVVAAAKVSTTGVEAKELNCPDKSEDNFGLINYLMKHRHGTPFEHNMMTFFINAPIFVWREWHRHRIGFSYNEESARYRKLDPVFYVPESDRPMIKRDGWKAGKPKFDLAPARTVSDLTYYMTLLYEDAYSRYAYHLRNNIDPGLARDLLPVGIYSSCWVTCNARSLMSFLSLRTHNPNSQFVSYPLREIEMAAEKCEAIFSELYPLTHRAFEDNGRVAP